MYMCFLFLVCCQENPDGFSVDEDSDFETADASDQTDEDAQAHSDADGDVDGDADGDSDADSDTDDGGDGDADGDSDADGDIDGDGDADGDSDADSDSDTGFVCDPGETQACTCPPAKAGTQECRSDRMGWTDCECREPCPLNSGWPCACDRLGGGTCNDGSLCTQSVFYPGSLGFCLRQCKEPGGSIIADCDHSYDATEGCGDLSPQHCILKCGHDDDCPPGQFCRDLPADPFDICHP